MIPFKKLWIFNGYNIITKDDSRNLLSNFTALGMGSDFFTNFNIGVVIFFLPTIIGLILLGIHKLLIKRRKPNKLDVYAKEAMGDWQISALLLNIQQLTFAFVVNVDEGNQKAIGIVFGVLFLLFYAFTASRLYEKKNNLHSQKLSVFGDFKQQFEIRWANFYILAMGYRFILSLLMAVIP